MKYLKINNTLFRRLNGKNINQLQGTAVSGGKLDKQNLDTFVYTTGTLPSSTYSLTCYRVSSPYGNGATGVVANNATLYYGDVIYWEIVANTGYNVTIVYNSSNPKTVYHGVVGVTEAEIVDGALAYTYTRGTLPTGVTSLICYRTSSPNGGAASGAVSPNETIYWGDTLYWTATADTPYNLNDFNYNSTSNTLTVNGNVTGVNSTNVSVSVKSYTFILTQNSNVASIGLTRNTSPYANATLGTILEGSGSITIYYGDTLEGNATAATNYHFGSNNSTQTTSASWTVSSDISWSPTASLHYYTYTPGSKPTGIASWTCHRRRILDNQVDSFTGETTIYYGDKLWWSWSLEDHYHIINNTYYNESHALTVTGNVTGSTATGLTAAIDKAIIKITNDTGYSVTLSGGISATLSNGANQSWSYDYGTTISTITATTQQGSGSWEPGTLYPSTNNEEISRSVVTVNVGQSVGSKTVTAGSSSDPMGTSYTKGCYVYEVCSSSYASQFKTWEVDATSINITTSSLSNSNYCSVTGTKNKNAGNASSFTFYYMINYYVLTFNTTT